MTKCQTLKIFYENDLVILLDAIFTIYVIAKVK